MAIKQQKMVVSWRILTKTAEKITYLGNNIYATYKIKQYSHTRT